MSRLENALAAIHTLCDSMNELEFSAPGIFTNAVITKPEVTTLIRDALVPEQSLYRIKNNSDGVFAELKPERIDGKSIYVDHNFAEWHRTAVRIPELVPPSEQLPPLDEMSSPSRRQIASQYKLISPSVIETDDVNVICSAVSKVVEQHPSLAKGVEHNDVWAFQKEYNELLQENADFEEAVADQKRQLDYYNDSLNELSPLRSNFRRERDVDELIQSEEAEIRQLEEELTRRQGR